jgi:myo-inositol-1(or 4)-monophosphatase
MSDQFDPGAIAEFAVQIAEESGRIALEYFRTDVSLTNKAKKRAFDPVTRADQEIEQRIRARIRERFPGHRIVGEEYGEQGESDAPAWFIDPIDGTRTFISGSPMWGVLLGLMDGTTPIAGLMHQPFVGETFVGSAAGAFHVRDGRWQRLSVRRARPLSEATLACTHPSMFRTPAELAAFQRAESRCRLSRYGTECYGYCLLAAGFIDLVIEADLEPYDIVPLIPVVEAAGGVVSDWNGNPAVAGGRVLACATKALHDQVLELLSNT